MDTIADNLSNVNTTGFKSETPEFQTLLYQDGIQPGANSTGQTVYPSGLELGTGVKVASIKDTLTQGTLTSTGNPLDLAINGSGYFQVLLPNGQTTYTRDGLSAQLHRPAGDIFGLSGASRHHHSRQRHLRHHRHGWHGVRHAAGCCHRVASGADPACQLRQSARPATAGWESLCIHDLLRHRR